MRVPFADLELSRRLERAEGYSCATFVEAHARLRPDLGAVWMEAGGAYAMYDGIGSPLTQTFGLGVFEPATPELLDTIEAFFRQRNCPVHHEVSPLAGVEAAALLVSRGYRPIEINSVMYRALGGETERGADFSLRGASAPPATSFQGVLQSGASQTNAGVAVVPSIVARTIEPSESAVWEDVFTRAWLHDLPQFRKTFSEIASINATRSGIIRFLAELDGAPAGAAVLIPHEGIALLAGAATLPEMRRRGAQNALLHARLQYASTHGCDVAMMCALPGGTSQKNAERNGFRVAYTRTKWELPVDPTPLAGS